MCQQVYFPTADYPIGVFLIVNVGLCNILRDLGKEVIIQLNIDFELVTKSISMSTENATSCLKSLNMTMEPLFENIAGLILLVCILEILLANHPNRY